MALWSRRVALAVLGLLAAFAALPAQAAKPNIVFVLTDDMTYADLAAMPRTRALVGEAGIRFERAYVNVSLCCPSRSTTLTGRYAQNTKVFSNGAPDGGYAAFKRNGNEQRTIATTLASAGYRTALFGKYLNGYPTSDQTYVPPGWSDWVVPIGPAFEQLNYSLNDNRIIRAYGDQPADYAGDVLAGKALDFIDASARAARPFFLYLSFLAPHTPAAAAPRHADLFGDLAVPRDGAYDEVDVADKPPFFRLPRMTQEQKATLDDGYRRRLRSLQAIDEAVQAIHDRLDRRGLLDETYIVFTSDNGFRLGEHRLGIGKETAYEEDIHVPLLVRGPGIDPGTSSTVLVDNADHAPTFADLAGVAAPTGADGRSFADVLSGDLVGGWRRRAIPIAHYNAGGAIDESTAGGIFKGLPKVRAPAWRGVRTRTHLYVEYADGARELYDTRRDPQQLRNIAASASPALVEALSARAEALAGCAGTGCRALEDAALPE